MIALRMSAPGLRSRYVGCGNEAVSAFAPCVLVVPPPHPAYRILTLGAKPKTAFSRAALHAIATALHRALGRKDRCCIAIVGPLFVKQPEGLGEALHSAPSETGMPKVIGLCPPQVSGALISERCAKDHNTSRSLAGCLYGF